MAFFLFWGGAAAVLPYIAVYFESVHLSGRQIGQLTSIPFFISLISSVAFGFLSDVSMKNRLIMRLCSIGIIVVLFLYPQAQTFASLLPVVLLYSMFHAPTNPILDKMTLDELESPEMYGKVRAGGSIGWGIMVLVTGLLMDKLGFGIHIMFYINIAFMVLFLLITAFMPQTRYHEQATRSDTSLKKLGKFLLHPSFLTISLLIIIWGIGEASIQNFLFLHIKQLGGSSTLMGAALSISLVGEIVTFSLADKIQTKIGEFRMILQALSPFLDGYKIDLKCFTDKKYRTLGGKLEEVLDTIRCAHDLGMWVEIVTLVIPDFNDSNEELWNTARHVSTISMDIPWHVTAFYPTYKHTHGSRTSADTIQRAAEIGQEAGLRYVYAGNLPGRVDSLENTYCPKCQSLLISRTGYLVQANHITPQGACPKCGETIAGVWS